MPQVQSAIVAAMSYPRPNIGWTDAQIMSKVNQKDFRMSDLTDAEMRSLLQCADRDKNLIYILEKDCQVPGVQAFISEWLASHPE